MKSVNDYKEELLTLSKKAVAPLPDNIGKIIVFVTTLKGIYPIKNAIVTIFKGSVNTREDIVTLYTDQSGKTEKFSLEAPSSFLSQKPQSETLPYSLYNISVHADGYREQILLNLPVFAGVTSMQSINLIALNSNDKSNYPFINNERKNFNLGGKNG